MPHIDVLESTVTIASASSTSPSNEASFFTSVVTKKKIRRTNAQIQAGTAAETTEKMIRCNTTVTQSNVTSKSKSVKSKSAPVITSTTESTIVIGDKTFPLQTALSVWSTAEQIDLIKSYKS